ncbi:Mutanase [Penicillium diatomitis]|uniref:Mutanase n=1 Tax=Penicillium diatomitis TaxID=2819901 RepID=A0A9X0BZT9_9EURO|nr:Mutanase [Penicillium diatomitis]KAJ5492773.1 Mutanase [Penicillium diatomitis]
MFKALSALRSFCLILDSSWFCEEAEKVPVFSEPLAGLEIDHRRRDRTSQQQGEDMGLSSSSPYPSVAMAAEIVPSASRPMTSQMAMNHRVDAGLGL